MPFEDLLVPKSPPCRTCSFIEALDPATQEEVDAAMAKTQYGNLTIARALATLRKSEKMPAAPADDGVKNHRERGHRR